MSIPRPATTQDYERVSVEAALRWIRRNHAPISTGTWCDCELCVTERNLFHIVGRLTSAREELLAAGAKVQAAKASE